MKKIISVFIAILILNSCPFCSAELTEQARLRIETAARQQARDEMARQGILKPANYAKTIASASPGEIKINAEEAAKVDKLMAEGKAIKVKGLYLGMKMGHAQAQAAKLFQIDPPRIVDASYGPNKCIITDGADFGVGADKSDMKVDYIALTAKVFNVTADTDVQRFVQAFIENYNIPEMDLGEITMPGVGEKQSAYIYDSPEGYRVAILTKAPLILIQRTAKKSAFNFD